MSIDKTTYIMEAYTALCKSKHTLRDMENGKSQALRSCDTRTAPIGTGKMVENRNILGGQS